MVTERSDAPLLSEEQFRLFFDKAPIGKTMTAPDGRLLRVNAAFAEMLGYTTQELQRLSFADITHPDDLGESRRGMEGLLSGTLETWQLDKRYLHRDGRAIWAQVRTCLQRDPEGRPLVMLTHIQDIDAKTRTEKALRESEERFRRLAEHFPDVIFRCTPGPPPLCESISPAAAALSGYTTEALAADPGLLLRLVEEEDRGRLQPLLAGSLAEGSAVVVRWLRRDGERRWMEFRGSAVRDPQGRPVAFEGIARDVTERRRSEEQLRLQAAALEATANAIVITDVDGTIRWVNGAFTRLTGYTSGDAIGQNPRVLRSGVHQPELYAALWSTVLGGDVWHGRLVNRRKDGSLYHEEMTITPFSSADDRRITRFVAIKQDVSDRVRAEEELRRSEERYRALFDGALEGIFQSSAAGRFLSVNPAFARILGYDSPEQLLASVTDIETQLYAHPEERAPYLEALREHGFVSGREAPMRRKDGTLAWLRVNTRAVRGQDGELLRLDGMVEDITERRRSEDELLAEKERYRVLFDDNPLPMWAFDPETLAIVDANRAAARQYGYTQAELVSLHLSDLRPEEEGPSTKSVVETTPPGSQAMGTWKHRRKDGSLLDVDVHLNDVVLGGRRLKLATLHDVTQQKTLEEEYRQAQKMEAIGRLAGGVAHDFNNLLTVINGYAELLQSQLRGGDPMVVSRLAEIGKAGERAADLTRQLLAFSRKQVVAPKVLDLNRVIADMEKMLRRLIGEDVRLATSLAPDLGCVLADRGQLEQVILNLAVNARDAMPRGGTLTLETVNLEIGPVTMPRRAKPEPGRYVQVRVADSGTGMDAATLARLFEPFFTTKEQGKGTGLGLSTVYGIVQQSGGHVSAQTELGRGSAFEVLLPRVDAPHAPEERRHSGWLRLGGTGTVLVVEDESAVRWLARGVLEAVGYTVLEASDAASALELLEERGLEIDVLLTDMVMPGLSGPELAVRVRERFPRVRVVFMSGYSDQAVTHHPLFEARQEFLQKPFRGEELATKMRKVLRG